MPRAAWTAAVAAALGFDGTRGRRPGVVNDMDAALRDLRHRGYTVRRARSGHWHVRDGAGRLVAVVSSTPSDVRALRNLRSQLRRAESAA